MAHPRAAWGIEIGAHALKAIRLEREGDGVKVTDFAVIPHKKVLSTPDIDQDELVRLSLGQFISQHSLEGEHLVMSVPGHAAFARFAKLPPVEPKKVPDIVKFEAVQQIPFPIDQVEWDYQTFTSPDTPEVEVGIFAITRERVQQRLGLYADLGISPETLTLSPVAVFNALSFDLGMGTSNKPVMFLDIGTQASDLIVAEAGRCWIRTFPLGGTHFTDAIVEAFKLSYSKAEKLKYEAATSKYAKQIMQAMRPVFSDLLQEVQRSIGYYQSLHRDAELGTMIGLGSTFKIPGLRKFLGQQLQMDVGRLDEYRKIAVKGREAASFAENAVNMATAYGLALQGVGLADISANLVPVKTLREQMWHSKTKWFAAAAAIVVAGACLTFWRPMTERSKLDPAGTVTVENVVNQAKKYVNDFNGLQAQSDVGFTAENMQRLVDYRVIWPHLVADVNSALASAKPQPALLGTDVASLAKIPPAERNLILLNDLSGAYVPPGEANAPRTINVTLALELSHSDPVQFLSGSVATWLRQNADRPDAPYRITNVDVLASEVETVTVSDTGEMKSQGRGSAGGSSSAPPPRGRAGEAPKPPPPPPGEGGRQGLGGMGGAGTGRKAPTDKPIERGGIGSITGSGGATSPTDPSSTSGGGAGENSGGGGWRPGQSDGSSGDGAKQDVAVDELAPLPVRPSLYPPNSSFYRVPITFTIELKDPHGKPAPEAAEARAELQNGAAS
jgi:type IV pilus assembly protein PilM